MLKPNYLEKFLVRLVDISWGAREKGRRKCVESQVIVPEVCYGWPEADSALPTADGQSLLQPHT